MLYSQGTTLIRNYGRGLNLEFFVNKIHQDLLRKFLRSRLNFGRIGQWMGYTFKEFLHESVTDTRALLQDI